MGEHCPDFVPLDRLFRHLAELDFDAVHEGGFSALQAWRAIIPNDVRLVRLFTPRTAYLTVTYGPIIRDIVVKMIPAEQVSGLRRLTEIVERSRAHRSNLWAHRLRALGIETPRPLGYCEFEQSPRRHASFAVFEYIEAPTLLEVRESKLNLPVLSPDAVHEKRALIGHVAAFLRTMHSRGVFHGDLHAGNLLIAESGPMLVDLDSMRTIARRGQLTMKNLVRLNRDFLETSGISRTDRFRFLSTYLQHDADRGPRLRSMWWKVLRLTERKLLAARRA